MNESRSKKVRFAANALATKFPEQIRRACEDKAKMPNRNGYAQHTVINPKRQIKKMVLREGIA